jgi:predicted flap endonuclease-1-like 5' DNA nuclease
VKIEEVEGIGPAYAAKLAGVGAVTTDAFLERASTKSGRQALAETTGISERQILEWANHVDLMRISGVGSEYSDLLEAAGVDSPAELAQRNAANLAQTFQELDAARNTVRRIPGEAVIQGWIDEAKTLAKAVEH